MAILNLDQRGFLTALSEVTHCNPFTPQRIALERGALGDQFVDVGADWNVRITQPSEQDNVRRLLKRATVIVDEVRQKLSAGQRGSVDDMKLYEDAALFVLYHEYRESFDQTIAMLSTAKVQSQKIDYFDAFGQRLNHYLRLPGVDTLQGAGAVAHLFACFFQIRRAFHHIYMHLIGGSCHSMGLKAAVWQSIFTHDMRRYRRLLYDRMGDYTTLVTGPSGTGKELVARAIGLARYVPFNTKTRTFAEDFAGSFYAVNLSALSPTLIESELFGHKRGSFTGAVSDRPGLLEVCRPLGTVFLDEIGELDPTIQVKLLRVLQTRRFSRIGEADERSFEGKIIAATNRDVHQQMHEGRFRPDFYYRLCSDQIVTPGLREQLDDRPEDLRTLVVHFAQRLVGEEAEQLAGEVEGWINANLGAEYAWPGNVRELEQCVRNVLIRREYRPAPPQTADDQPLSLGQDVMGGRLTAEQLLDRYCDLIYRQCGSYVEVARRLGLDRRTVKARIDHANRRN